MGIEPTQRYSRNTTTEYLAAIDVISKKPYISEQCEFVHNYLSILLPMCSWTGDGITANHNNAEHCKIPWVRELQELQLEQAVARAA